MLNLDDLFPLKKYNLDYYELFLEHGKEKANQIFDETLKKFLNNNDPNTKTKRIIEDLLGEITIYYKHNNEKNNKLKDTTTLKEKVIYYYKVILNEYEYLLTAEEKFNIFLKNPIREIIESYIKNNYQDIKNILKKHVYINSLRVDDLEDLFEYQMVLDFKYKNLNLKADWGVFSGPAIMLLYKYFQEDLKFLEDNKIEKYPYSALRTITYQNLKEIYSEIPKKDINISTLNSFFKAIKETHNNFQDEERKKLIKSGYSITTIFNNSNQTEIKNFLLSGTNAKILKELLDEENINFEEPNSIYSLNFLNALNKLSKLENNKLKESFLYLKCFKLFLKEFLTNFEENLSLKDFNTLEIIFRRSIKRTDSYNLLKIKNKKALYHNYKTDEIINNLDVDLEFIKSYNYKHYVDLEKIINSKEKKDEFLINPYTTSNKILSLQALKYLGYENAKLILKKTTISNTKEIIDFIKNQDISYKNIIINLFKGNIEKVLACKNFTIKLLCECIKLYYKNVGANLTINKLYKILNSVSYALFPNNKHIEANLVQLNLVAKGDPFQEKIEGIKLYEEYRKRINSTIPDYSGQYQNINYELVNLHSPEIISNGIGKYLLPNNQKASSCLTPNGKAATSLKHGATNPNGRFLKLTYRDKIIAYSWIWRAGEVLCIDNIEVTESLLTIPNYEKILYDIYKDFAINMLKLTKNEPKKGLKLIVLGRNKIDLKNKYFDTLTNIKSYQQKTYKPNSKEELYLKDSEDCQLILAGEYHQNLDTTDIDINYPYHRADVIEFKDIDQEELSKRLDAIYFDYCLSTNNKYVKQNKHYQKGYLGNDWYIGYTSDTEYDFYYLKNDDRLFEEAKKYTPVGLNIHQPKVTIIKPPEIELKRVLEEKNYEIDNESIQKYLNSLKEKNFIIKDDDYTHTTKTFETLASIIEEKGISSNNYGKRLNNGGCNGNDYISVAKVNSKAYNQYLKTGTMLIDSSICAFAPNPITDELGGNFTNTSYPLRKVYYNGEYHVPNFISLDKIKAFLSNDQENCLNIAILLYLEELYGLQIPIISTQQECIIEKDIIKKYIKLKK